MHGNRLAVPGLRSGSLVLEVADVVMPALVGDVSHPATSDRPPGDADVAARPRELHRLACRRSDGSRIRRLEAASREVEYCSRAQIETRGAVVGLGRRFLRGPLAEVRLVRA